MKTIEKVVITIILFISMFLLPLSIPEKNVFTPDYTNAKSIITIDNQFRPNMLNLTSKYTIPLPDNYYINIPPIKNINMLEVVPDIIAEVTESNIEPEETHEEIINRLVHDVDTGKAGNGEDRKEYLGEYYDEVQKIIDEKYKISESNTQPVTITQAKSDLQRYAHDRLIEKGFTEEDFTCLVNLWNKESGWDPNAHNNSSGAHGIPQALPASKMSSYGSDYYTSGYTQINWGIDYIINRYGSPINAWKHFQNKHWY